MSYDFHVAIPFFGSIGSSFENRSQTPLEARDHALNLPALPIDELQKSAVHLATVFGLGPFAAADLASGTAAASVEVDYGRADAQRLSGKDMVALRVVATICQQPVDIQMPHRLHQSLLQKWGVLAGTYAEQCRGDQMSLGVANQRHFGPFSHAIAFAHPPSIMRRAAGGIKSSGIDRSLRRAIDQTQG